MAVLCKNVTDYIESFAPTALAEDWDNVGLLIGSSLSEIKRALVCLDVTDRTVNEAMGLEADMIISHHPVIFKGIKRVSNDDTRGSVLYRLIQGNMAVYCAHTNLDVSIAGINTLLAQTLGLCDIQGLKPCKPGIVNTDSGFNINTSGSTPALGKVGLLKESIPLGEYAEAAKKLLNTPALRIAGNPSKRISKAAVFCGSFDDDLKALLDHEADVLITGEIKYHTVLDALEAGLSVIEAGHFISENIIVDKLVEILSVRFGDVEFLSSKEKDPYTYI
jgi:dinuclear metal center YbgI/SA1388 family protein